MTKLSKADRDARTTPASVPESNRAQVIKVATSRVKTDAAISFRRTVRK